jgi:hypothetical protein
VRRAFHLQNGVRDRAAEAGKGLLQLGLVVDMRRQRVLDP